MLFAVKAAVQAGKTHTCRGVALQHKSGLQLGANAYHHRTLPLNSLAMAPRARAGERIVASSTQLACAPQQRSDTQRYVALEQSHLDVVP